MSLLESSNVMHLGEFARGILGMAEFGGVDPGGVGRAVADYASEVDLGVEVDGLDGDAASFWG